MNENKISYFLLLRFPAPHNFYWLCNTLLDDFLSCILAYTKRLLYRIVSYYMTRSYVSRAGMSKMNSNSYSHNNSKKTFTACVKPYAYRMIVFFKHNKVTKLY